MPDKKNRRITNTKYLCALFFLLIVQCSFANMGSPLKQGTLASTAFSSKDIDILQEKIFIKPDEEFQTASWSIEYHIKTEFEGKQIPLLFLAKDYKGNFRIWVDEKEIKLVKIPDAYRNTTNSPFAKFSNSFEHSSKPDDDETTTIYWTQNNGNVYKLKDLKYFEISLKKGEHTIKVEYLANVWIDISGWVKEYSFRYSFTPAQYWNSFGNLEIRVDASLFGKRFTINTGQQQMGITDSFTVWNFRKLPGQFLQLTYIPKINSLAQSLIAIGPAGLAICFTLILAFIHFRTMVFFSKKYPLKKISRVLITGSIIIPLLILVGYICSYNFIDTIIGSNAGKFHGYTFMAILLFPVLMPLYWLTMWLILKLRLWL
jgi:hypothetical protein